MIEQANEWRIPIFVMDCDVAAAFDHVSHHLIIDGMEALNVPPVLVSAWIRENRGSETYIKLDDILTPGVRRTRSVPQGDIRVQRICLGLHWICQRQPFVKGARPRSGDCQWVVTMWGYCSAPTTAGS